MNNNTFKITSAEVIQIYQRAFHENPYHENPSESDVSIWDDNDTKILALKDGEIMGFHLAKHEDLIGNRVRSGDLTYQYIRSYL